jgi:hypothetical protein
MSLPPDRQPVRAHAEDPRRVLYRSWLLAAAALVIVMMAACMPAVRPALPRPAAEAATDVIDVPREHRARGTLPCPDEAARAYVVSAEGDLYGFRPDAVAFQHVGRLGCHPTDGARPTSMAVDRSGTAWIHYEDGTLHRVSTRDASCVATAFGIQHNGFFQPGMAFATTRPDPTGETLFVWAGTSVRGSFLWNGPAKWTYEQHGLARIDPATLELELIGYGGAPLGEARTELKITGNGKLSGIFGHDGREVEFMLIGREGPGRVALTLLGREEPPIDEAQAELTGTDDGKLYGFFGATPATLAEIDPTTGRVLTPRTLPGITTLNGSGLLYRGGDFYVFWARKGETSTVTRVSRRDGALQEVARDVGFHVVGAGASTCGLGRPMAAAGPGCRVRQSIRDGLCASPSSATSSVCERAKATACGGGP